MKTRLVLWGIAGILSVAGLNAGAQDAGQPANTTPSDNPVKKKDAKNDPTKSLPPVMKDTQLIDKLKAASANLSPPVLEIVRMSDGGADAVVLQAFVENSAVAYNLRAEEIIYLHDHGIATSVVTAMIQHGASLREQAATAQAAAASQPAPAQPQPAAPAVSTYATPPLTPAYVYPSYYPSYAYAYTYPAYAYEPFIRFGSCYSRPYYWGGSYAGCWGGSFGVGLGRSFGSHFSGRSFGHRR